MLRVTRPFFVPFENASFFTVLYNAHNGLAQCWMQCGTGLVKMFKRSMLLRHRIDPSTIMPRHHTAYQQNNAKNH